MDAVAGFVIAAFALTGSPGPNTLSLAAAGAAFGPAASMRYLAGLNLGMVAVMAMTGSGVAGAASAYPPLRLAAMIAAAVYFAWLAFRIATAPPLADPATGGRKAPRFRDGVLLSLVNPKAYAAMASLFSGFVLVADAPFPDAMVKILLVAGVLALVNPAGLLAGRLLTGAFRNPKANRALNIAFAVLLLASVMLSVRG